LRERRASELLADLGSKPSAIAEIIQLELTDGVGETGVVVVLIIGYESSQLEKSEKSCRYLTERQGESFYVRKLATNLSRLLGKKSLRVKVEV
jgi:hypothetical protein